MSIRIFPKTGQDHVGFIDDAGRRYIIDRSQRPALERLTAGVEPNESLLSWDAFVPGEALLRVTSVQANNANTGYVVYGDQIQSDVTLTSAEVSTLAHSMQFG
jgi:hypothetical protein